MRVLPSFSQDELKLAKRLMSTKVAAMMGRKLEEGDWGQVYCNAKGIPDSGWSNLHIDVNYNGLGVEHKLLRFPALRDRSIKTICGTTQMHPAATRSIHIPNVSDPASDVMVDVFRQYSELIQTRTDAVRKKYPQSEPDMRLGWLLWENSLTEFLYFEESMVSPNPEKYYAMWNKTEAKGARKESLSLWIFDRETKQKRFSVTTNAGIKIQPYFDVPSPDDPNLVYIRAQSEPIGDGTILLWMAASTAKALQAELGSLDREVVSLAIMKLVDAGAHRMAPSDPEDDYAVPVPVSVEAHALLRESWEGVSDEHFGQLLLKAMAISDPL